MGSERVIVAGAGPAGLTAAYELGNLGIEGVVFEADRVVGGISRTVEFEGCRMDLGGHRFFTKVPEIEALWHEILGDDLLTRRRMSRIHYRNTFFDYPLKPMNALRGLGFVDAFRIVGSYIRAQMFPEADESTFDAWVRNRFGDHLFRIFFKTYTEKVWGMPCSEISADWAAQRIKNMDLKAVLRHALVGKRIGSNGAVTSLIEEFYYPRLGPGMLWERCRDLVANRGIETRLRTPVVRVHHEGFRIQAVDVKAPGGAIQTHPCPHLITSIPITKLVAAMTPEAPQEVLEAARRLRYRDFVVVGLIVDRSDLFPDNWIYVHAPEVRVGRIQNFANWSPDMVPEPGVSCIGFEYFVNTGDDLWSTSDEGLIRLAGSEAAALGLFDAGDVRSGKVVRVPRAYPVYDAGYQSTMDRIRSWLGRFDNLSTVGRNGQHRYNNQDHSMLTGLLAARNIDGGSHNLWSVNAEPVFHEEVRGHDAHGG